MPTESTPEDHTTAQTVAPASAPGETQVVADDAAAAQDAAPATEPGAVDSSSAQAPSDEPQLPTFAELGVDGRVLAALD